ncbi:MAG: nuclease SbcCD, subunit [Frankiales bacterium]|nr:nuclease SbcCD, subunit [Frankiales bacterium]
MRVGARPYGCGVRLLHTSDWHLGRSLHRASLATAQEAFVDHLVDVVTAESVDVVLVSGDVYDRAVPPLEAVELCSSAFARLRAAGARVVVISGNHDSARRLGFGSSLIDSSGVFLRTSLGSVDVPVVIDGVPFFAVPYLEPSAEGFPSHVAALTDALSRVRAVASPSAVVLAHCWVAGCEASESERDISVGGVSRVPVSLFDGFAYGALGHLHGAQVVTDALRYSGSPLAYSFSEAGHVKGSWLVELGGPVSFVPAPVPRRLSAVRGTLAELLSSRSFAAVEDDWLSVTLTDAARPEQAMERLSARFPHVLVLSFAPAGVARSAESYASRVRGSDVDVASSFVSHVRGTAVTAAESALLAEAFEAVRVSTG